MSDASQNRDELLLERADAASSYYGPTNFTWLVRGRLGGSPCPGLNDSFASDAEALKRVGITLVVTLTKEWEPPTELFAEFGLKNIFVPIPDMGAPTIAQAEGACKLVEDALSAGETVLFHCRAGRGRTGTLLAALLIWFNPDFDTAISRIKATNRYWIESAEQMKFLAQFAAACKGKNEALLFSDGSGSPVATRGSNWLGSVSDLEIDLTGQVVEADDQQDIEGEGKANMALDKALQTSMATIPECLASGYVDMETGMLLGVQTIDSHPQEVLDTLAAATADLFQGSSVVFIEEIFKKARGTKSDGHYFNEFLIFSDNLIHVFMRTKKFPNHVCCFVCRKTANPGMVLTKARMSLDSVSAAL